MGRKILLLSDNHFQNIFYTSDNYINISNKQMEIDGIKCGQYFYSQYKSFEYLIDYCRKERIDYVFDLGDVFEKPEINTITTNLVNKLFTRLYETINGRIIILSGNHDSKNYNNPMFSKVLNIKHSTAVSGKVSYFDFSDDFIFVFVPYFLSYELNNVYSELFNSLDNPKNKKLVLFAHHDLIEIDKLLNIDNDNDFTITNYANKFFEMFFGHYHKRILTELGGTKLTIIGAYNKTDGKDEENNQDHGFAVLEFNDDLSDFETNFYNLGFFPYIYLDYEDVNEENLQIAYKYKQDNPDCFITLIVNTHRNLLFTEEFELKTFLKHYDGVINRYKIKTFFKAKEQDLSKVRMDSLKNLREFFVKSVVEYLKVIVQIQDKEEIKEYVDFLKRLMIESTKE